MRPINAFWFMLIPCTIAVAAYAATASEMSVQVKKTDVRKSPTFLGNIVSSLHYADKVSIDEKNGAWMKVSRNGNSLGWVHSSALTSKIIALSGGDSKKLGASSDEVATSGKGFNQTVENEYKAQHKNIDFSGVDRMEKITFSPERMEKFIKDGGVSPQKGVAP